MSVPAHPRSSFSFSRDRQRSQVKIVTTNVGKMPSVLLLGKYP